MTARDPSFGKTFQLRTLASFLPAVLIAVALFCCGRAHAAFNEIITGARPQGMGGAFVAVADDANAMYWNPAGLAGIKRDQGTFMHARKFSLNVGPSLEVDFVGLAARKRSWGSLGFFYTSEGSEEILTERVIGLSYGRKVGEYFSLGLNLKAMTTDPRGKQTDANDPAMVEQTTAGVDLGLMYAASEELRLAVVGRNFGVKVGTVVESDIDPGLRFGLAYAPSSNWTLSADVASRKNIREKKGYTHLLSGGIEYVLNNFLALRAGVNNSHVALGLGFLKSDWQLDYAFWNSNIGDTHRVSATMKFGEEEKFEKVEPLIRAPSIDIVKIENKEDLERILDQAGEIREPGALRNYRIKRAIEAETAGTSEIVERFEKALEGHNIENMRKLQKIASLDMEPTDPCPGKEISTRTDLLRRARAILDRCRDEITDSANGAEFIEESPSADLPGKPFDRALAVETDLESAIDRELARTDREISENLVRMTGLSTPEDESGKVIVPLLPKNTVASPRGDESAAELLGIAKEKFAANDFDAALDIYKKVLGIDPTCALAFYKAGIICRMKGQRDLARKYITMGFELDPKSVYSKYRLILK